MTARQALKCVVDPGIAELAEGLKALADPNRLRIVCLLLGKERCVCEVEKDLGISQQLASHHLNVLKEAGLLRSRKEGTSSYYAVVEGRLNEITEVFMRYLAFHGEKGGRKGTLCCETSLPACEDAHAGASRRRGRDVG